MSLGQYYRETRRTLSSGRIYPKLVASNGTTTEVECDKAIHATSEGSLNEIDRENSMDTNETFVPSHAMRAPITDYSTDTLLYTHSTHQK